LKAFGYKYFLLRRFGEILAILSKYIFICRVTVFKLADGLKIRDIKRKCDNFESRSMVLSTSHKIRLQNVVSDYLEIFAKMLKTYTISGKIHGER